MENHTVDLIKVRVEQTCDVATSIRSFKLTRADGLDMPPFEAGAHIDVHIGPKLIRQDSICSHPIDLSHYMLGATRLSSLGIDLHIHPSHPRRYIREALHRRVQHRSEHGVVVQP